MRRTWGRWTRVLAAISLSWEARFRSVRLASSFSFPRTAACLKEGRGTRLFSDRSGSKNPRRRLKAGAVEPDSAGGKETKAAVDAPSDAGGTETELKDDIDDEVDVHRVSDAVALQACRAYLVRKKRLGVWPKQRERKDRLIRSSLRYRMGGDAESPSASSEAGTRTEDGSNLPRQRKQQQKQEKDRPTHIGYFWEDPSELKYYVTPRRRRLWKDAKSSPPSSISVGPEQAANQDDGGGPTSRAAPDSDAEAVEDGLFGHSFEGEELRVDGVDDDNYPDEEYVGAWEFISQRPRTPEEDAAVDDLCDDALEEADEFSQRDDDDDAAASGPEDSAGGGYFSDDLPPASHVRRSQAAKRSWSDPQFRKRWHKARWGTDPQQRQKKKLPWESGGAHYDSAPKRRRAGPGGSSSSAASPFPPLPLEAVADMSEDEIAHAIRTYLSSRQKRRESRLQTMLERRQARMGTSPSSPALRLPKALVGAASPPSQGATARNPIMDTLMGNEEELKRRRLERSERASRAYQTRLANQRQQRQRQDQQQGGAARAERSGSAAAAAAPRRPGGAASSEPARRAARALARVEACLDRGRVPSASDVERALEPARLGGRKRALVRALADVFGMRGRCVPAPMPPQSPSPASAEGDGGSAAMTGLTFVTTASVEQLGSLCLRLIRETDSSRPPT